MAESSTETGLHPQRTQELMAHGSLILRAVISAHDKVREVCAGSVAVPAR